MENEKLEKFKEICLDMSNKDKENLKEQLDKKANKKIEKEVDIFNKKLEIKLDKEKIKLEKDFNKKLIDLQLESKKELLAEEEKEKDELFYGCVDKLTKYTNTDEYINLLNKILENSISYFENKENLTICLTNNDKNRTNFNNYGNIEILEDKYIGGLIIKNNHMIIDNTFLTSLKETNYEKSIEK